MRVGYLGVQEIKSKDPSVRMRSLSIFRIFTKYLSLEEAMWFCFLYLADSNREVFFFFYSFAV